MKGLIGKDHGRCCKSRFNVAVKGVSLTLPSHLLNSNDDCKEMTMIIFMIADGKNQCPHRLLIDEVGMDGPTL